MSAALEQRLVSRSEWQDRGYETPCLISTRSATPDGYTRIKVAGKLLYVHRVAWELWRGPIPEHYDIDHKCRQSACFNPEHLEPTTRRENTRRGLSGRLKTHCKQGHEYTPENTGRRRSGHRYCLQCNRERVARR